MIFQQITTSRMNFLVRRSICGWGFCHFSSFLFAFLEDIMLDDKPMANMLSFLKGSYHFFFKFIL